MGIIVCALIVAGVVGSVSIICYSSFKHKRLDAGVQIQKDNTEFLLKEAELPYKYDEEKALLRRELKESYNSNNQLRSDIKLLKGD